MYLQRASDPLEVELQVVVSSLTGCLELRFSTRAANAITSQTSHLCM